MTLADKLRKEYPELIEEIGMVIHDWNGLRFLLNNLSKHSDDPEYSGELTWDNKSKEYWDDRESHVHKRVQQMDDLLYRRQA